MAVPVISRRAMLNGLFGHPEYVPSYNRISDETLEVRLYIGDPYGAGVEVDTSGTGYIPRDVTNNLANYPDTVDNTTKTWVGPKVTWLATADWGTVTHVTVASSTGANVFWVIELDDPVIMNDGMYLGLDMPTLVWDDGTTVVGMRTATRTYMLGSLFSRSDCSFLYAPQAWKVALFVGDPLTGGVEVDAIDYERLDYFNGPSQFNVGDPHLVTVDDPLTWAMAQDDWGTVTHWAFFSEPAPTNRHCAAFDAPIDVVPGVTVKILADQLQITFGAP